MNEKYIVFDIETSGLSPLYSWITCICAKDSDGIEFKTTFETKYEPAMIREFLYFVKERTKVGECLLISCNGKKFDLPFIFLRFAMHQQNVAILDELRLISHFDIQEVAGKPISLNDLSKLFGCEQKNGTGENAVQLAQDGKWKELQEYCMQDVNVTEQVYLKMKQIEKSKKDL